MKKVRKKVKSMSKKGTSSDVPLIVQKEKMMPSKTVSVKKNNKQSIKQDSNLQSCLKSSCIKKALSASLLIAVGMLASGLYFEYKTGNIKPMLLEKHVSQGIEKVPVSHGNSSENKIEVEPNALIDKHYLAVFSYRILEDLRHNLDYASPLKDLLQSPSGFEDELKILSEMRVKATTSNANLISAIDSLPLVQPAKSHSPDGWWDKLKSMVCNIVSIKKLDEPHPNNMVIISSLKDKIRQGNFRDALNMVEAIGEEARLSQMVEVLKARLQAQEAADKIFNYAMKND